MDEEDRRIEEFGQIGISRSYEDRRIAGNWTCKSLAT